MIGQHLHKFDLQLCDYALGTIAGYMHDPAFLADLEVVLTNKPLLNHLKHVLDEKVDADEKLLLLNDDELYCLEPLFDGDMDRSWTPSEPLHRRYVQTLPEIREHLSRQAAEDWSDACGRFARQLEERRTRLSDGIAIVREWVGRLRTLLRVMGAVNLLPAPEGGFPTPTHPNPSPLASSPPPAASTRPEQNKDADLVAMVAETRDAQREIRDLLVSQRTVKDFYTTAEVAAMLDKAEFTVREWCRNGRVNAVKQGSGRGKHQAWVISHDELQRLQREGLLPAGQPD